MKAEKRRIVSNPPSIAALIQEGDQYFLIYSKLALKIEDN